MYNNTIVSDIFRANFRSKIFGFDSMLNHYKIIWYEPHKNVHVQ